MSLILKSFRIAKIRAPKLIALIRFVRIIIGLPYEGENKTRFVSNIRRIIAEDGSKTERIFASFRRRIVAIT